MSTQRITIGGLHLDLPAAGSSGPPPSDRTHQAGTPATGRQIPTPVQPQPLAAHRVAPTSRTEIFEVLEQLAAAAAGERGILIVDLSVDDKSLSARIDFAIEAHQARFDELTDAEQLARDYTGPLEPGWDWGYDRRWTYLPWWLGVMIRPRASRFCTCIPVSDLPEVLHRLQPAAPTADSTSDTPLGGDLRA
jgi:hypothetical protein